MQAHFVLFGKTPDEGAIDIQHAVNCAISKDRKDNFGIGGGIAGDMPGKLMYVVYPLHLPGSGGSTADTFSEGDHRAGDLS